jgi:hypothetical protein
LSALLPAALVAPATPARQLQDDWRGEVKKLLTERATAVAGGNEAAFMVTVSGATESFRSTQRTWFRRFRTLPIGSYELVWAEDEFGDLARDLDRTQYPNGVHVLQIKERYSLRGYDKRPSAEDLFLTVTKTPGGGWSVVADDDVEDIALQSNRNLWDFGEVRRTESEGIMVVYHPAQASAAPTILAQAKAARKRAKQGWPYPWNDPIVIMVPSTVDELERVLQTTFDLSSFVAFAVSSVDRTEGYSLDGHRVYLHWSNFKKYGSSFQTVVLAHEFTHLATRDIAGPYLNSFFDEGVALQYGEGGGSTTQLRRRVRARTLLRKLVPEWYFLAGSHDEIFLAYEEAASFCAYLIARSDRSGCARAYKTLGTIDPVSAGTGRYHADRVLRGLFGHSIDELERAWADRVYRENK